MSERLELTPLVVCLEPPGVHSFEAVFLSLSFFLARGPAQRPVYQLGEPRLSPFIHPPFVRQAKVLNGKQGEREKEGEGAVRGREGNLVVGEGEDGKGRLERDLWLPHLDVY